MVFYNNTDGFGKKNPEALDERAKEYLDKPVTELELSFRVEIVLKAEPEVFDDFLVVQAALLEVLKRGGRLEQTLVVIVHNLGKEFRVARFGFTFERIGKPQGGGALDRCGCRCGEGRGSGVEDLEGVTEAHAVEPFNELDGVAGSAARHAVPQALAWRDDEVRVVGVLVERAQAAQVAVAVLAELDAA